MQTPLASYSASCASNSSAYPNPLTRQTHFKNHVVQGSSLGSEEGLISKEHQHRAAAGISSTGHTKAASASGSSRHQQHRAYKGSISSMSLKRQATLPEGQLHSWEETQAFPSRRSSGKRGGLHMNGLMHTSACARVCCMCIKASERVCMCTCTKWLLPVWAPCA